MQNIFSDILRLALVVSLSDREKFVNQVSAIIEQVQHDPEKAEQLSRFLMQYLNNMKDNMNRERVIKNAISSANLPDKEQLEELTKAIQNLTTELQKDKAK